MATFPLYSCANSSIIGAIARHGPHHEAQKSIYSSDYVVVLGEYGGIGYPIEGHLWWNKRNWGYIQFNNTDEVTAEYVKYATMLKDFIPQGMSAAIYTQTTDVEGEVNGFVTYDRKVEKLDPETMRAVARALQESIEA